MMPHGYAWIPVLHIAVWFFIVSFDFRYRSWTHPQNMGAVFFLLFRSRLSKLWLLLLCLETQGLCAAADITAIELSRPSFLLHYTRLPLVLPPNSIHFFPPSASSHYTWSAAFFRCFQKMDQLFCWDLILSRTCGHVCLCMGPDVMLSSLGLSLLKQIYFYISIAGKVLIDVSCP